MKESLFDFEGKTVLVTGAAKGIGAAIVGHFVKSGAKAIMADVDEQGEAAAADWREAGYDVQFVSCDVSHVADVEQLIACAESEHGGVDVVINNAGIFPRADLLETGEAFWDRVMGVNLKGVYLMCKAVVPGMIRRGGGSIVNIGSLHAVKGEDDTLAYAVSKGGIVTLTRNLAHALAVHKIRVNCVHPGWVASDGERARLQSIGEDLDSLSKHSQYFPLGRMQTGEDIAYAVAFLSSQGANQITGQMLTVDGGLSL